MFSINLKKKFSSLGDRQYINSSTLKMAMKWITFSLVSLRTGYKMKKYTIIKHKEKDLYKLKTEVLVTRKENA